MRIVMVVAALAAASARAEPPAAPPAEGVFKTAKERLSDKATDAQRVDDCKVAPARRTRARPTACPWDVGS